MDILIFRQRRFVNLYNGTYKNKLPVRLQICHFSDKFYIKPFINHTEKSKARVWYFNLVIRFPLSGPGREEKQFVDRAGKRMYIIMKCFLGLVQFVASGK